MCVQPRQTVLTAAGSIGQASGDLLRQIGESETDERFQVKLHPVRLSSVPPSVCCSKKTQLLRVCHSVNRKHSAGECGIFLYFAAVFLFTAMLAVKFLLLFHEAHTWLKRECYFNTVFGDVIHGSCQCSFLQPVT